jgi:hypothetical protein
MGKLLIPSSILTAVISVVLADDLKAWMPWLTRGLVVLALSALPASQMDDDRDSAPVTHLHYAL